jgi:hypothetical protein
MTTRVILAEQIAEVGREIGLRRNVYPKWIESGKLSQALADRQIACLEATLNTLKWLQKHEAAIRRAAAQTNGV